MVMYCIEKWSLNCVLELLNSLGFKKGIWMQFSSMSPLLVYGTALHQATSQQGSLLTHRLKESCWREGAKLWVCPHPASASDPQHELWAPKQLYKNTSSVWQPPGRWHRALGLQWPECYLCTKYLPHVVIEWLHVKRSWFSTCAFHAHICLWLPNMVLQSSFVCHSSHHRTLKHFTSTDPHITQDRFWCSM